MNSKIVSKALISDFDGTITKEDFFYFVIDKLLTKTDIQPWIEYQQRKIRHVDALDQIFNKIRLDQEKFIDFILGLPIEECFVETVHYCNKNNIDFYILSAGADYYIKIILEHLKVADKVTLVTNRSHYTPEGGLRIIKAKEDEPFYSIDYGISKKLAVESIQKNYDYCIFAGDGGPDIEPAKIADYVFARGRLLELCRELSVPAREFNSYCEILDYLKNG